MSISPDSPVAVVLAAGKGTRMLSDLPKVVHPVGGEAMVRHVVRACHAAGCARVIVVVGYKRELVEAAVSDLGVEFAHQAEQHGTGHAVACAADHLRSLGESPGHAAFVLAGDGPLIRASTLRAIFDRHTMTGAAATMATAVLDDPTGYGRIVREPSAEGLGAFRAIVEHRDASAEVLRIREVNPSYYCFDVHHLLRSLPRLARSPGGEYYLTDVPALLLGEGLRVEVLPAVPAEDVLSINTPEELSRVDMVFRARSGGSSGGGAGSRG